VAIGASMWDTALPQRGHEAKRADGIKALDLPVKLRQCIDIGEALMENL
jgi:hypothetical protein